jgi:enamine deaminase RidA (YjgF/YER057c/UK114 family)
MTDRAVHPIEVPGVPRSPLGHPHAVAVDDFVFVSGQMATGYRTGVVPALSASLPDTPYWHLRMEHQARQIIETTETVLEAAGSTLADCLKVVSFHTDLRELPSSMGVRTQLFTEPPASTAVGIAGLPIVDAGFQFEVVGSRSAARAERVPVAAGGSGVPELNVKEKPVFSPAVRFGDLIFTQGSIATGSAGDGLRSLPRGLPYYQPPIRMETEHVLRQLGGVIAEAGGSLSTVVKADVYIAHPDDYPGMDAAFQAVFPDSPPARTVTVVRELVVRGARTEISLVALTADGATERVPITVPEAEPPLGHEAQAIRAEPFVFLSTQIARRPQDPLGDGRPQLSRGRAEVEAISANTAKLLEAAGSSLQRLVRLKAFHTSLDDLPFAYRGWEEAVGAQMPAFTALSAADATVLPRSTCSFDVIAAA